MSFPSTQIYVVTDDFALHHADWDTLPDSERILLMVGQTINPVALSRRMDAGLSVHSINHGPFEPFVLAQRGLELFGPDDRGSRSSSSGAQYVAFSSDDAAHGGHSILVQVLPNNCVTSTHFHLDTREVFVNLLGSCQIATLDRAHIADTGVQPGIRTLKSSRHTVQPGTIHCMRAVTSSAVNVLFMKGLQRPTDMADHHYVDTNLFDLFLERAP